MASHDSGFPATLDPEVQGKLKADGITGLDALWHEIGKRENHSGVAAVVAVTGVSRRGLIRGLMDHAVSQGDEKGKSWPRRHALDLLLIVGLIVLAWLVWRAVPIARSAGIAEREKVSPAVAEKQFQGRSRVSFRVQPEEVERLSDLPALVSLVISSKGGNGKPPATERLLNVPVLEVGEKEPSITVALTEPQIRKILPLLPEDRVYVVQPIP